MRLLIIPSVRVDFFTSLDCSILKRIASHVMGMTFEGGHQEFPVSGVMVKFGEP
jgi:hypothetical protein